jgi:hypothetical protein
MEKRVKLDEWKKCLYEWIPYIRVLDQNNLSFEKILLVWSIKNIQPKPTACKDPPLDRRVFRFYTRPFPESFFFALYTLFPMQKGG